MAEPTLVELIEAYERALAAYDAAPNDVPARVRNRRWKTDRELAARLVETGEVHWKGVTYECRVDWVNRIVTREADEIDREGRA